MSFDLFLQPESGPSLVFTHLKSTALTWNMTKIRKILFAEILQEYLEDPASFEQERYDASLYTVEKERICPDSAGDYQTREVLHGLCFAEHIELVMILLLHGYKALRDNTGTAEFSSAISEALQVFAEPIPDGDATCFLNPSFLLHGLAKSTLQGIVAQIGNNGRIIHDTLRIRDVIIEKHGGPVHLAHGMKMLMEYGCTEDYCGICCYLTPEDEKDPHGTDCSYIAKTSFFLDTSKMEIIVMTMQGQRVKRNDKKRSRDFARLAIELKMDPRAYSLKQVCEIGKKEGYRKVKVIRPTSHPMYIDNHVGFKAGYASCIKQAGVLNECDCYLESSLELP